MNTAENNMRSPNSPSFADGKAPVLAQVPWLAPAKPASAELPTEQLPTEHSTEFPAAECEPQRSVAAPSWEVTTWDTGRPQLRIDPPQPLATSKEIAPPPETLAETPAIGPVATLPPQPAPTRQTIVSDDAPPTHLRFDPPERMLVDHAPPVRDRHAPHVSEWHAWVAAIDNTVRQYHKVIMLAALLTAAGLMMLVLENTPPAGAPLPEVLTPAASDHLAAGPMPLVEDVATPPRAEVSGETETAQGPQSDRRSRKVAAEAAENIPLEPLEPQGLSSDEAFVPILDEPSDWTIAARDATATPGVVVGYPTTDAPALVWPTGDAPAAATSRPAWRDCPTNFNRPTRR